jgi:hypothetical protein
MSVSLHDTTIPALTLGLTNLVTILDKAIGHADARKIDHKVVAQTRLILDMHPLARQVQMTCDTAKGAAARLAGVEVPKHEDTETTLAELKARIEKTLAFIATIRPAQLEGVEAREIVLAFPSITLKFNGLDYVRKFALPNFYFHLTMTYAVLRANGVDVGKSDYLGAIQ